MIGAFLLLIGLSLFIVIGQTILGAVMITIYEFGKWLIKNWLLLALAATAIMMLIAAFNMK